MQYHIKILLNGGRLHHVKFAYMCSVVMSTSALQLQPTLINKTVYFNFIKYVHCWTSVKSHIALRRQK